MRKIHEISRNCFTPELIDVIIPSDEQSEGKLSNVFMVMEYQTSDLAQIIQKGVTASISSENL